MRGWSVHIEFLQGINKGSVNILVIICNITEEKQPSAVAEEEQNQPEAVLQGSPEEQSMETNSGADVGQDLEKEEKDKRREAKVC